MTWLDGTLCRFLPSVSKGEKDAIFLLFYFTPKNGKCALWQDREYQKDPNLLHTLKKGKWGDVKFFASFVDMEGNGRQIITLATNGS